MRALVRGLVIATPKANGDRRATRNRHLRYGVADAAEWMSEGTHVAGVGSRREPRGSTASMGTIG